MKRLLVISLCFYAFTINSQRQLNVSKDNHIDTVVSTWNELYPNRIVLSAADSVQLKKQQELEKQIQEQAQKQKELEEKLKEQTKRQSDLENQSKKQLDIQNQLTDQSKKRIDLENQLTEETKKQMQLQNKLTEQSLQQNQQGQPVQQYAIPMAPVYVPAQNQQLQDGDNTNQKQSKEQFEKQQELEKQLSQQNKRQQELEEQLNEQAKKQEELQKRLSGQEDSPEVQKSDKQTQSNLTSTESKQEKQYVKEEKTEQSTNPEIDSGSSLITDASMEEIMKTTRTFAMTGDTANNKRVVVYGGNVIVGNNNVILFLDDKSQLKEALKLSGKEDYYKALDKKDNKKNKYKGDKTDREDDGKERIKIKDLFTENLFEHFSLGIRANTLGVGIELATTVSRNFQLRAGYNFIDYSRNYTIETDDPHLAEAFGYDPDYKTKGRIFLRNGHALLDLYPMRNGVFHFTGGIYFGKSKLSSDGRLVNPETGELAQLTDPTGSWPNLNFADYEVKVTDGYAKADIKMGNYVKPYFGIGFGKAVPKSKFGVKFELGVLYQGDFIVQQNGKELEKNKNQKDSFINEDDYTKWLKWYPMVNLQFVFSLN
jgi:Membrane-bound metallopeptidase